MTYQFFPAPVVRQRPYSTSPSNLKWMILASALLVFCTTLSVAAQAQSSNNSASLRPFELSFQVFRNGSEIGEATISLKRVGEQRWLFETDVRATRGLASLVGFSSNDRSEFELHQGRLRSLDYQGEQSSVGRKRERMLAFDWQQGELVESGRRQGRWPLSGAVIDRHLSLLALSLELRGDSVTEKTHRFDIAWSGGIEAMDFTLQAGHTTDVPAGRFETVRAERVRENSRRETYSWHAAELGQLPVRIEHHDGDGDVIEMRLLRLPQR